MNEVMNDLIAMGKVQLKELNKELEIQKSDAARLSVYIDDAIKEGDYQETLDYANMLKDTCIRIDNLSREIAYIEKQIARYSK